jgi:hypothetical protein
MDREQTEMLAGCDNTPCMILDFSPSSTESSFLNQLTYLPWDYVTRSQNNVRTAPFQNKHKLILPVHLKVIISQ